jgi:PAS domain S-box-containing protein
MRKIRKNKNNISIKSKKPQNNIQTIPPPSSSGEKSISGEDPLEKFFIITENSTEIIYHMSLPDGIFKYVSPASREITGYSPDEFYQKPWFIEDIIHPSFREQLNETKNILIKGNIPPFHEFQIIHKSGMPRWLFQRFNIIHDEQGRPEAIEGIVTDVTERKQAEEKLRDAQERYQLIVENANEGIAIIHDGYFVFVNPKCTEISGYTEHELMSKPFATFLDVGDKEVVAHYQETIKTGSIPPEIFFRIIAKSGAARWLGFRTVSILWKGNPASLNFFNDITEHKLAEDEQRKQTAITLGKREALLLMGKIPSDNIDEFLHHLVEIDASTLDVDRVSVWQFSPDLSEMICTEAYDRSSGNHTCILRLKRAGYPRYFKELDKNRIIAANDARTDERTSEFTDTYLVPLGITSMLDVPIWRDGQIVGIIRHEYTGLRREWMQPEQDFAASVADLIVTTIESSQRRAAEAALRESEERYRSVVEDQSEFICRFDPEGKLTFVNDAYCRYFGLDKQSCIRNHHNVRIPPEDARMMKKHLTDLTLKNPVSIIEHRIIMPNGEIRWQRWSDRAIFDKDSRVVEYQSVGRDTTDKKVAEEALRDSERQLADIINFIPDATFAINREGKIIAWNRAIEEMTGVSARDILGKGNHEYGIPFYGERRPILIDLVLKEDEEIKKKYPLIEKKGDKFISEIFIQRLYGGKGAHLWFIVSPLYDMSGEVIGAIESIRNVSDRKRAEESLRALTEDLADKVRERTSELEKTNLLLEEEIRYHKEAEHKIQESLDEKVVLLREIHHRVKNNLQVIISILNLQSRYVKDDKSLEALRDCQNRVKAMAMVHERLYQTHDLSKINVAGYIRDITQILFHFYGFSLKSISLDVDVENIFVDINTAIPLGLMINELFSNALKYAFPEGKSGKISVVVRKDGDMINVVFADTGIGIPAELDWRNSPSLGLKLVTSLVEQLQGTIELHRDEGTRFDITLKERKA